MAKHIDPGDLHQLWVFGQSYDFYPVTHPDKPLNGANYVNKKFQKTQIVLHNTAGNSSAENTIDYWNTGSAGGPTGAGANFVVERILTAQAPRPAKTGDQADTGLVDAIRVIDEELWSNHAGNYPLVPNIGLSATSFGIEIACLGEELDKVSIKFEPDGVDATTKQKKKADGTVYNVTEYRATDQNRWLRMPQDKKFEATTDVQALDDEQYMTLTLLLRHL